MIGGLRRIVLRIATAPVRLYQLLISPALPARCKYEPSCSSYALAALRSHGVFRGSILAAWRLVRCNPFSHGGYDPVESQTLFRRGSGGIDLHTAETAEQEHDRPGALA